MCTRSTLFSRTLLLVVAIVASSGCRAPSSPFSGNRAGASGAGPVAIVAVADTVQDAPSRSGLQRLLERTLAANEPPETVPAEMAKMALGEARFVAIGDEVARHGVLSAQTRGELLSMPIPVRQALLVRIERNDTEVLEPQREPILDAEGGPMIDREAVVLSRRRHVRIAASLVDLDSGEVDWQQAWQAEPDTSLRYVDYTGSSLAASVAVTLTNTVVSGLEGPSAPAAVDAEEVIAALFRTLVRELVQG